MPHQYHLQIADQRAATPRVQWLTLHAPELARNVKPGQYLLVRCAELGSADPLLRRALFVAAAEEKLEQIGLLYTPDERGLAWLARGRTGDALDVLGPFGHPFTLDRRTRNLLLVGAGPGLGALLLLAQQALARNCAVTLLVSAPETALLPPPFLLPGAIEYQSIVGAVTDLLKQVHQETKSSSASLLPHASELIKWADQVCAALPDAQLTPLYDAVRAVKYRWERGFASVLHEGPLVCGVGACGVCTRETRRGPRLLCTDGPVFESARCVAPT